LDLDESESASLVGAAKTISEQLSELF
jgi:hypothetical protein